MRVKPVEGRRVRDPVTKFHIPDEGIRIPEANAAATMYWFRRIRSGDVVLVPDPVVQPDQIPDSSAEK
jgi:hypothetical protein